MFRKLRKDADLFFLSSKPAANRFFMGVHKLHIQTCSPRAVDRAHRVGVPTDSPIVSCLMPQIGNPRAESVLRSDTARGNVHRLPGKELFGTAQDLKRPTTFSEFV